MVMQQDQLAWGLKSALPAQYNGAWGARVPITPDGEIGYAAEQQDFIGDPVILEVLADRTPLTDMLDIVEDLLASGWMRLEEDEIFVLTQDVAGGCYVLAQGSGDHVCMVAWC